MFRFLNQMLATLGSQFTQHKLNHNTRVRFEYCREIGCNEMRQSARHAYEIYNASGDSKASQEEFRTAMTKISRTEMGPGDNMVIPKPRLTTV